MKKLMIALMAIGLLFAFTQCDKAQENTTVVLSGKIVNSNAGFVAFSMVGIAEDKVLDTAFLEDDGSFKVSAELTSCGPATMHDGKEVAHLYLCPGDSLFITLDAEEFDESIRFEGKGSGVNTTLSEYFLQFLDYGNKDFINFYAIRDTSLNIYIDILN